jgi:hypothetical protein
MLALALLVLGVFALDSHDPFAANHFAFAANLLNRCPDLHDVSLWFNVPEK